MKRALAVLNVLGCLACGNSGVDQKKFDALNVAAKALQVDANASGGASTHFAELLQQFQAEIAALNGRTRGRNEAAILNIYAAANDSYSYCLRFQRLDRDAVGGMVLLSGANRPVAARYALPTENRGGGRWVNRKIAMQMFVDKGEAELKKANRLVGGEQ
jgi:hypothetical protein